MARLRAGVVGEFLPLGARREEKWLGGSLKLEPRRCEATLIADVDSFGRDGLPLECSTLVGRTEVGDVLLAAVSSRSSSRGEFDVARYGTKHVLVDVDMEEVDASSVTEVQLGYYGLRGWNPEQIYKDEPIMEDGRSVGWKAELRHMRGTTAPLDGDFKLRFGPGWEVGGQLDRRTFSTPLMVTVGSETRRPIAEHALRLDAVHALLNISHQGQVDAFGGSARLTADSEWCGYWQTDMMTGGAVDSDTQEFPYIGLPEVGGVSCVARWVQLVMRHRRAVSPIVRHTLFANQTPESRLLSTAAAMESWVAAHRRREAWARKVKDEPLPTALTREIDRSWDDWVGDSDKWVEQFWHAYLVLKHRPEVDLDPEWVHMLEVSGRWLLTASLLDDCADSLIVSQHLFNNSLRLLGHQVREALTT